MKKISLCLVGLFLVSSFALANRSIGPYDSVTDDSYSLQGYSSSSIPPLAEWNKTYGGTGDDYANSIVQSSDGGYAIAGVTRSFGAGLSDFWLVKADAFGSTEWNRTYGGASWEGENFGVSLIQTSDGGFALAGTTNSFGAGSGDFWLIKTDSAGNVEWNKTYGGSSIEYSISVIQSSDGGYVMIGSTFSTTSRHDFWIVKTDSLGNTEWNKTFGGPEDDVATSVVQTFEGGYAVAGPTYSDATKDDFWLVKTDSSGNLTWSQSYGGFDYDGALSGGYFPCGVSVVQTDDGGYLLGGNTWSFGAEWADFLIVKVDATGRMQWSQMYGGPDFESLGSIISTGSGYVIVGTTGDFVGGDMDVWVVKTDLFGIVQWNQTYGGTNDDFSECAIQTRDGGYAVVGSTGSFGAGGHDFWLIKLRPEEDVRPYYGVTDLNRDGKVDILDLSELAKDYGSSLVLPSEPNKTVVTVVSFDREPPEVENARVAIIDPEVYGDAVNVTYTNSSGIATFDLSSNKNYTAIAWSGSAHNYANFTTDSLGEASVLILLGELSLPPIRSLPQGWIILTVQDNETSSLFMEEFVIVVQNIEYNGSESSFVSGETSFTAYGNRGVYVFDPTLPPNHSVNKPHSRYGIVLPHAPDWFGRDCTVYSPDENGCANVVAYVTPP